MKACKVRIRILSNCSILLPHAPLGGSLYHQTKTVRQRQLVGVALLALPASNQSSIESVKDERFIRITTRGRKTGRPHEVELWFAFADGKIFLSHEGELTDWMKNIEANQKVSGKIGSVRFESSGRLVKKGDAARELGEKALYEKYYGKAGREVIEDWFSLSSLIEIIPE